MAKLIKIAEIKANVNDELNDLFKTLENQGFHVVDDDPTDGVGWKLYHVLKEK